MKQSNSSLGKFYDWLTRIISELGFGMRTKLILLLVTITVIPLVISAFVALQQTIKFGNEVRVRTQSIAERAVDDLSQAGEIVVNDAVQALDDKATDEIERMTTDAAHTIASFLYYRDDDLRFLATLDPNKKVFQDFISIKTDRLIKPRKWVLAEDGKSWVPTTEYKKSPDVFLRNEENKARFSAQSASNFEYENVPLYLEATYIDLTGQELVKVTTSKLMDPALKNVADKQNTFCKAEDYFSKLKDLKAGEIYVSEVIGEYVGSKLVGMYTPENAKQKGVAFEPEKAAYVGDENPNGKRFHGLIRFAMPVEEKGKIVGYVTLALNHDHIISKIENLVPNETRYSDINAAASGNYTFMWDPKGYSIFHPRHHSIAGFNAETGERQPALLDVETYDRWQTSGLSYTDFIKDEPAFEQQSRDRKPAIAQVKQGIIGLDCRHLDFAPQCTDWYNLAQYGGSGSFLLLWSGLWKLTTVSAIPYYTGQYGDNLIGFGILTMTVGIDDFRGASAKTQETINKLVEKTDLDLTTLAEKTSESITDNLQDTGIRLSISTIFMSIVVVLLATWMASVITKSTTHLITGISRFSSGYRKFRFNAKRKDEFGILCNSLDEMFGSIVKSTKNPMVITDINQKIIYVNNLALELWGKKYEEIEGLYYPELSIFGDANGAIDTFLNNKPSSISYKESTQRYYKSKVTYLVDRIGDKIGYIAEAEDVTQLIIEQERIERERSMLDMILSETPDIIWYKNIDGTYLVVNRRFGSMLGLTPEEIHGRNDKDLLAGVHFKNSMEYEHDVITKGIVTQTESLIPFADGHEETLDIMRMPIIGPNGEVRGILGVGRDVSERVRVESELRKTQQDLIQSVHEATEASKSKSEFLARMSHEIRTPMNAIIGMTNITKRKLNDESISKQDLLPHVVQIESSSIHLLGLLNDILDISKIEAGKIELGLENFDISKLIQDVTSIISPRCESKNIKFTVNSHGLEHKHFISDALRLRQILINLLGNAVKFTPELGNIEFNIEQKERKDGKSLIHFSVSDSGIGIAPDKLKSLFMPFEQGGGHITRMYGGTGLGLSISRNIAKLFGSEIQVISEENKGSEFYFSIWLTEDTNVCPVQASGDNISIIPGKKVLLVDDVEINRIIAIELLSPFDLIIEEANDGTEAVEKFAASEEGYYDLVLMDIQMPNMNGYEATKAIRELERSDAKTTAIVAMTANAFKEDTDLAFASGMNEHIAKPIEMEKLLEVLKMFLGDK